MSAPLHLVCPHCDAVNRVPADRLVDAPSCGKCAKPLFTAHPVDLDATSFDRHIGRSDIPVLVAFEPQQALRTARSLQRNGEVIILTGSTYMIEQALNPDPYLRTLGASFGWRMHVNTEASGTMNLNLPQPPPPLR